VTFDGNLDSAGQGESVTLELADEIDVSRGDMLVSPAKQPAASTTFAATIVWMSEKPLIAGQHYLAKHTTRSVKARVTNVRHRVNVNTLAHESARDLEMNAIAVVDVETSHPLFFDLYEESRSTGSFILIDPISNATVAAGMILEGRARFAAVEAGAHADHATSARPVTSAEKFERHGHRPATVLVSGSVIDAAERALFADGFETIVLRGDSLLRESLSNVIELLHSAGFIILVDTGALDAKLKQQLKETHRERPLFDLFGDAEQISNNELISRMLARAASLRLRSGTERGE
jgi:bifunctional enzyme CysN/CysC